MSNQQSTLVLPSNPADQKAIMDAVKEIDNAMTRAAAERDYINETLKHLASTYSLPKKHLSRFARHYHKNSLTDQLGDDDDFEALVSVLAPSAVE